MDRPLRILYLEDDPDFIALVEAMLRKEGISAEVVSVGDFESFTAALKNSSFDVILADYLLPSCNGIQALQAVQQKCPDVPFLLISGTIGEQAAIQSLRCGATDYVLKERMERLEPVVRRAVQEAQERARRKRVETELVRREKYFRTLTENSLDILTILNGDGVCEYNSPSLKTVLGFEPRTMKGRNAFELVHPDDLPGVMNAFERTLKNPGVRVTHQFRCRHQSGTWCHLETVCQNRLSDPEIGGIVVNARDITDRKLAEAVMRESEKQYRLIFEGSPVPIWVSDLETSVFLEVNEAAIQHYGYSRAEFLKMTLSDIRPSEEVPRLTACLAEIVRRRSGSGLGRAGQWRHRKKDGTVIDTEVTWSIIAFKGRQALLTMANDVTERSRAEQALRDSEQRFRDLFEGSPDAIFVEDLKANVLDVNPAACHLHGVSREQLVGRNAAQLVPPGRWEKGSALDFGKLVTGEVVRVEGESWTVEGTATPVEVHASRVRYGDAPALLLHVRDITERKRAAEALERSEASLLAAQRIAHLGSWELDVLSPDDQGNCHLRWSDETYRIFGFEPRTVPVTNELFWRCVHPEDHERVAAALNQVLRKREPYDLEHRIILPGGEERTVRERAELIDASPGKPVQLRGIVVDITERKRLEEQLRQSQKMEAIGQLAGGVAHDFNNILTVIHGHASLLLYDKTLAPAPNRSAQQIGQAAERAAGLTRQLLAFSRRQVMQPRRLDLNQVVSNVTMMLGRILGEDISLQLNYWPEPAFAQADSSMIEQVFLNLAVNARDAMPKGGQLAIRISVADINVRQRPFHPESRSGSFVCLAVTDNGCGIAPENLRRIFEPFFTTKGVGKGTGLGLATVYGIVKQHQGWVEVESEPGNGSTFQVYLPVSQDAATPAEKELSSTPLRGGNETILVVEDEAAVRDLVSALLVGFGYRVLHAETGVKALDVWRQSKDKVDLLLTDVVMPDRLNGRELAEKLRAEQPDLKVIFTSGYSADVVGKDFVLQRGLHYLQKPYDPEKLAATVRHCLDS